MANVQSQVNVKADEQTLRGVYANTMMVTHTHEEFVIDFLNVLPPQAQLVSRVITSPGHLKRIITALADNVQKYEATNGPITASLAPTDQSIGFRAE